MDKCWKCGKKAILGVMFVHCSNRACEFYDESYFAEEPKATIVKQSSTPATELSSDPDKTPIMPYRMPFFCQDFYD